LLIYWIAGVPPAVASRLEFVEFVYWIAGVPPAEVLRLEDAATFLPAGAVDLGSLVKLVQDVKIIEVLRA
jgi:hypothetical protein